MNNNNKWLRSIRSFITCKRNRLMSGNRYIHMFTCMGYLNQGTNRIDGPIFVLQTSKQKESEHFCEVRTDRMIANRKTHETDEYYTFFTNSIIPYHEYLILISLNNINLFEQNVGPQLLFRFEWIKIIERNNFVEKKKPRKNDKFYGNRRQKKRSKPIPMMENVNNIQHTFKVWNECARRETITAIRCRGT